MLNLTRRSAFVGKNLEIAGVLPVGLHYKGYIVSAFSAPSA